jgi:hypothetical protein
MVRLDDRALAIKQRIESRGAIAKDVTLDIHCMRQQATKSLLESITHMASESQFGRLASSKRPRPIIIVPAMHTSGSLSLTNVKQFLENGTYVDVTNPSDVVI